jgi:membrane protease YdiL (CAAX protease family)
MGNMQHSDSAITMPLTPKNYPGLLPTIGFILLYFALQILCTILIMAATQGWAAKATPIAVISGLVISAIIQLFLMWLYLRKDSRMDAMGLYDFGHIPFGKTVRIAFICIFAAMAFNYIYATYLIPGIGMQDDMAKILAGIARAPLAIAAMICAIVIAAPIVEELLFRGLLQNALAKYLPIGGAILLSSFLFAAVHGQPYAIPGLMSLSVAFGYLYHRTGSLRTNIILHMANNGFALLVTQILN